MYTLFLNFDFLFNCAIMSFNAFYYRYKNITVNQKYVKTH